MAEQFVRWLLLIILVVSSVSLIVVFQLDYVAEALKARAIPLAIVLGFSSVAVSIIYRKI